MIWTCERGAGEKKKIRGGATFDFSLLFSFHLNLFGSIVVTLCFCCAMYFGVGGERNSQRRQIR